MGFLGHGGFASVYQVQNLRLHRVEALKVLLERPGRRSQFAARFHQEARVAASLEHPNIMKVYDFGNVGRHALVLDAVRGGADAHGRARTPGRMLDEEAAARSSFPFSTRSITVHPGGIIHRDIKPDNIILDGAGGRT